MREIRALESSQASLSPLTFGREQVREDTKVSKKKQKVQKRQEQVRLLYVPLSPLQVQGNVCPTSRHSSDAGVVHQEQRDGGERKDRKGEPNRRERAVDLPSVAGKEGEREASGRSPERGGERQKCFAAQT